MATPEWCVVTFDDGVQIVPKNWIKGNNCFWPTFKSTVRYEKAVKNCEDPLETWLQYPVRILGTYSSYEIAKPKLKLAEEQSDLNTDQEESKKRRKFKRMKVLSSSDGEPYEDEDEDEDDIHMQLQPFPQPRKSTKVLHSENESQNNYGYEGEDVSEAAATLAKYKHLSTPSTLSARSSPSNTPHSSIQLMATRPSSSQSVLSDEDFKGKLIRDLSFIKINLIKLNQRVALLETIPNTSKTNLNEDNEQASEEHKDFIKNIFPLQTNENVVEVEAKLQAEPEFKTRLIHYCSRIGGHKVDEVAKLILRKLFSDKLAADYSWLGAKKKRVFSNLIVAEVILSSVRVNNVAANATEKEIVDSIKNWLRHATTRDRNNRERKNRIAER